MFKRIHGFLFIIITGICLAGCVNDAPNNPSDKQNLNDPEIWHTTYGDNMQNEEMQLLHRVYELNLPLPELDAPSRYLLKENLTVYDYINKCDWAYNIYLPPSYEYEIYREYPVLFLLHGYECDKGVWEKPMQLNKMLDYYDENNLLSEIIVVAMDAKNTFYINNHQDGIMYEDYFFTILKPEIYSTYRVLKGSESCMIGGFSMGGYGASRYMLTHHEFGFCYAMSTPFDGKSKVTSINSLLPLFVKATAEDIPYFVFDIGKSDYLRNANNKLHLYMDDSNLPHEYILRDGGHDEKFWQEGLFIMLNRINRYLNSSYYNNNNDQCAGI